MKAELVEQIRKVDTASQRIYGAQLCATEAGRILRDLIVCYEEGANPEQMNLIYGDAVELMSLWRNNGEAIKAALASR